jgi:hypothetical protein
MARRCRVQRKEGEPTICFTDYLYGVVFGPGDSAKIAVQFIA